MPPMRTTVIASSFQALEYSLWGLFPEPQTVARAWSGLAVQGPRQPAAGRARVQEQLPLPLTLYKIVGSLCRAPAPTGAKVLFIFKCILGIGGFQALSISAKHQRHKDE